jgi:hypothetical protein
MLYEMLLKATCKMVDMILQDQRPVIHVKEGTTRTGPMPKPLAASYTCFARVLIDSRISPEGANATRLAIRQHL